MKEFIENDFIDDKNTVQNTVAKPVSSNIRAISNKRSIENEINDDDTSNEEKSEKNIKSNIVYSDTLAVQDLEAENNALMDSLERLEERNKNLENSIHQVTQETGMLKELFNNVNTELAELKKPSLLVAEVASVITEDKVIIKLPNGNKFYCHATKEAKGLQSGDTVLVEQKTLNVVNKIDVSQSFDVEKFVIIEKPKESWKDIGGLHKEMQEVREVIELPLNNPELFKEVGIEPPKGMLLHGPPGTGKTLLAKAVAHSTNATFIEVVGSELVQKFIGEGAKLVKEIFELARNKSPAIVFIDELDSVAAMRMDTGTSGEREVNRTFMQLLSELDGFEPLGNVKVIGATNRLDILDHAIVRPGRLDRLIEVSLPNVEGIEEVLKIHTRNMKLKRVSLSSIAELLNGSSGAEIKAVCTEAGYFAIREGRNFVGKNDFIMAIEKVCSQEDEENSGFFG